MDTRISSLGVMRCVVSSSEDWLWDWLEFGTGKETSRDFR